MGRDARPKVDVPRAASLRSILQKSSNNLPNFEGNLLADKVKSLGSDNHQLRMALQETRSQLKVQTEHAKRLEDEIERKNFEARENSQANLSQMQSLRDSVDALSREKAKLVEECARAQLNIAEANKIKAEVQAKLVRCQEEVKQYQYLEKALTTLKKDNQQLSIQVERLRNQLKNTDGKPIQQRSNSKNKYEQTEPAEHHHRRQQSEQIKLELEDLLDKLQLTNQSLEHELFIHREKVEWLEQDKKDLEIRHQQVASSLTSTADFYKRQLEDAMLELQSEGKKLRYAEQFHEELKEKVVCLDQVMRDLSEERNRTELLKQNLQSLEAKTVLLEQGRSEHARVAQELSEVSRNYSELLHRHEELQLEIRRLNEHSKENQEEYRVKLETLSKVQTDEWKRTTEELNFLKLTNQKLEEEVVILKSSNAQLKSEARSLKDSLVQLRVQHDYLQQKSEHVNQFEAGRVRVQLSESYKQLARLKEELKHSQNESARIKAEYLECSKEVLRLKDELKGSLQQYLTERDNLLRQHKAQQQLLRENLMREKDSMRLAFEKERQSFEAQMFVKVRNLESDMQSAQQQYHLKLEMLQKEQLTANSADRAREHRANVNTTQTEELLSIISHLEQKVAELQETIFHYTQKLLEKDTLLASRSVEHQQKRDILVLLEKLKDQEARNEKLGYRLAELEQTIGQKDSVMIHIRETAQQSRQGHENTIASYDRMVKELQNQLQQTCSEVVCLKREVDRLQSENSSMQSLTFRNQKLLENIDEQFSTAQKKLHDHKKNELLLADQFSKTQEERKRRLSLFGRLHNQELVGKCSTNEEAFIESLVAYCNGLEAKLQTHDQLSRLNKQLEESLSASSKELSVLREKMNQLVVEGKANRDLIIKMEDEHTRTCQERARIYQQEYDALLVKYEKYKNIARREKHRKETQQAIIRENNEFNEVIVQKCKAIVK